VIKALEPEAMTSVFRVLAGISRPKRPPIEFEIDSDVTVKEVVAKERTEQWIDTVVKMLMFGYNESFLNVYRGVFGGILLPFVLGFIMFGINLFVDSWAVSLTISPLTVIPAMLFYLNRLKLNSRRTLYRELKDLYDEDESRGRRVFVALYKNYRIIGHLASSPYHRQTAQLSHFFVRKEYRNRGVGTKLLNEARDNLRRQRYKKIRFGVWNFQTEFLEDIRYNKKDVCRHACTKKLATVIPFINSNVLEYVMDMDLES